MEQGNPTAAQASADGHADGGSEMLDAAAREQQGQASPSGQQGLPAGGRDEMLDAAVRGQQGQASADGHADGASEMLDAAVHEQQGQASATGLVSGQQGLSAGGLPPEHPLLQRAQQALRTQLQAALLDVNAKLREKRAALGVRLQRAAQEEAPGLEKGRKERERERERERLKASHSAAAWHEASAAQAMKRRREDTGVELFGQQEQLAKAQVALEQLNAEVQGRARARSDSTAALEQLKEQASDQAAVVNRENKQVGQKYNGGRDAGGTDVSHS